MATYTYERAADYFNLPLLMDQIIEAYPGLVTGDTDLTRVCHLRLSGLEDGSTAIVDVPDGGVTEPQITAIVDVHDSSQMNEPERTEAVRESAKIAFAALPGWANWTNTEWLAWYNTNVEPEISGTTPSTALVIKNLGYAIIYLRNAYWPDLQNE
ncbi:MAG: hypothetical protein ACYTEQ_21085 [Planctomycetota bacterium]|jgi:hypothetical protein